MRTVGRQEQVLLDQLAVEKLGLSTLLLMEHAALALVEAIQDLDVRSVSFLCGKGMNGGDAYAAARLLYGHVDEIRLYEGSDVNANEDLLADDTRLNRNSCIALGLTPLAFEMFYLNDGDLVVDALYGTGFQIERGMPEEILAVLNLVKEARSNGAVKILAVDLPSGVDANNGSVHEATLIADTTVSFIYPKTGIMTYPGRKYAGKIIVDSIGLPAIWLDQVWLGDVLGTYGYKPAQSIDEEVIKSRMQDRQIDSHKGINGSVTILAGSKGMAGAAILSTRAAIKAGGGLVRIVLPEALEGHAIHAVPSALIATLEGDLDRQLHQWSQLLQDQDAIAIGPGLGQTSLEVHKALIFYAIEHAKRLVLDADALNILSHDAIEDEARQLLLLRKEKGMECPVLTPHPGEAKRLLKENPDLVTKDRLAASLALQEKWSSVIVLKGAGTVVKLPSSVWINTSGNAGMAKGGSGDLLTGMLVSFLGQGIDLETAVISAVYLHGRAADLAVLEGHERSFIPDELLDYLSDAYMEVEWH